MHWAYLKNGKLNWDTDLEMMLKFKLGAIKKNLHSYFYHWLGLGIMQ